ncbi:MAG TPA: hypothetical protein VJZ02_02170 [Candidatus Brocadiales bacterium]|nr:hypothetical protein [Candidatus Brocadiales bacterium]
MGKRIPLSTAIMQEIYGLLNGGCETGGHPLDGRNPKWHPPGRSHKAFQDSPTYVHQSRKDLLCCPNLCPKVSSN